MPLAEAKKQVLLADDNEEYSRITATRLMRDHDFIECHLAHSIEEALKQLKTRTYDVILIDRGLPFTRGDYRHNEEDARPLAQSIKRKGDVPELCDHILEGNRKAYVILSTGLKGGLGHHVEGVDAIIDKGKKTPKDHILIALGKYEKTSEDEWEAARPTMTPIEEFLHNELLFSKQSPIADKWQEVYSLEGYYWEMLQRVRDRTNPKNPYQKFLSAAEKRFNSQSNERGGH